MARVVHGGMRMFSDVPILPPVSGVEIMACGKCLCSGFTIGADKNGVVWVLCAGCGTQLFGMARKNLVPPK